MKLVKSIVGSIATFFVAISKASRAAELARNQKWKQAQAMYRD